MKNYELKYGLNPSQKDARIFMEDGRDLPFEIINGRAGYINLLDAFNSIQLVRELSSVLNMAVAASFKHVSPSGVGTSTPLDERMKKALRVDDIKGIDASPLAIAYARARGTDRMSSYGDFIALSQECDATTAHLIKREVSDGVIAPSYSKEALDILLSKKKGNYLVIKIDENYVPASLEKRTIFGMTLTEGRDCYLPSADDFKNIVTKRKDFSADSIRDLMIAQTTLKYTQSNSVCACAFGQTLGIGAGQQSRVHCTRLALDKADKFLLRLSDEALNLPFRNDVIRATKDNATDVYLSDDQDDVIGEEVYSKIFTEKPKSFTREERLLYLKNHARGISLASDAFFPFDDNIIRAGRSGVEYVLEPGGSVRDDDVIAAADRLNMVMAFTGTRLFHH